MEESAQEYRVHGNTSEGGKKKKDEKKIQTALLAEVKC